jgi:hypothetical protein
MVYEYNIAIILPIAAGMNVVLPGYETNSGESF